MITDYGKGQAAILLGSQMQYISVGAGSQTITTSMNTLTGSEFYRTNITGSPDFSVSKEWVINSDINSVQASGLNLKQFGYFSVSGLNNGSLYDVTQLNGSLVCDGTIELSFESSYKVL